MLPAELHPAQLRFEVLDLLKHFLVGRTLSHHLLDATPHRLVHPEVGQHAHHPIEHHVLIHDPLVAGPVAAVAGDAAVQRGVFLRLPLDAHLGVIGIRQVDLVAGHTVRAEDPVREHVGPHLPARLARGGRALADGRAALEEVI
ncbi:MAG: hypothetical protein ACFB51_07540 [Anaerolineae bacterium]